MKTKSVPTRSTKGLGAQSKNRSNSVKKRKVPTAKKTPRGQTTIPDWTTPNWSGYARIAAPGTFSEVFGSWTVPAISSNPIDNTAQVTIWIGIDGFGNNTLIQTGTGAYYSNNVPVYYAWYEILPDNPTEIILDTSLYPVSPGDSFLGDIRKLDDVWSVTLVNLTQGWLYTQLVNYRGAQQTVEFVVERPQNSITKQYFPLANYRQVTFDLCLINDGSPNLDSSERGSMVDAAGRVISTPSLPDDDRDGFSVVFGSIPPPPPPSSSATYRSMLKQMVTILNRNMQTGQYSLQTTRSAIAGGVQRLANALAVNIQRLEQC